jgi:hypothetical protein
MPPRVDKHSWLGVGGAICRLGGHGVPSVLPDPHVEERLKGPFQTTRLGRTERTSLRIRHINKTVDRRLYLQDAD